MIILVLCFQNILLLSPQIIAEMSQCFPFPLFQVGGARRRDTDGGCFRCHGGDHSPLYSSLPAFHHSQRIAFFESVGRIAHHCCLNVSGMRISSSFWVLGLLILFHFTHLLFCGK